jgi:4-hydroxybenzoate polyprenyltransferase
MELQPQSLGGNASFARSAPLVRDLWRLARPHHWVKNVMVLLPVVFARKAGDADAWLAAWLAAVAFCWASSAIYAINDVWDVASDRLHPLKRHRPVASGRVSSRAAILFSCFCVTAAVLTCLQVNMLVLIMVGFYLGLQVAYSCNLKHRPIADVMCIALGFVLRALAGTVSIHVVASSWLVVCAFTLCLFIGFCKRWNEVASLGDGAPAACRRTLNAYTPDMLTHLMTLSAGVAIVSYLLYSVSAETVQRFGTHALLYTLPIVIYGICRLTLVSMQARYADPVMAFLTDKPLIATAVLWIIAVGMIVTFGERLNVMLCTTP